MGTNNNSFSRHLYRVLTGPTSISAPVCSDAGLLDWRVCHFYWHSLRFHGGDLLTSELNEFASIYIYRIYMNIYLYTLLHKKDR